MHSRVVPVFAVAVVAALAFVELSPGAPAVAESDHDTVVDGVLYDSEGNPESGAVNLVAWPSAEVLAALKPGQKVPTVVAGTAVADADGEFAIEYKDEAALAPRADDNGIVNFTVESIAGGDLRTLNVAQVVDVPGVSTPSAAIEAEVGELADDLDLAPLPGSAPLPLPSPRGAALAPSMVCGWFKIKDLGPKWVVVGGASSAPGATAKFTYKVGATSTIGVGVSLVADPAEFTLSGTTSVSSDMTIGMSPQVGHGTKLWRTQFLFATFGYRCGLEKTYRKYSVQAVEFWGGASSRLATAPAASYCTKQEPTSKARTYSQSAREYGAGASVAGREIGINLSAKTGYSSSTRIDFAFSKRTKLCGTNAKPSEAAFLVAKEWT